MLKSRSYFSALIVATVLFHFPATSRATLFAVTNLVSDDQGANPAQITDPGLVNAWGVSFGPTSPFWVSSNATGTSVLYRVDPATQATTKVGLVVAIPGAGNVTGQVFNGNGSSFNNDNFVFVSEDGTVSGWRGSLGTTAEILVSGSPANVYKGSAIAGISGNNYLYAANFSAGTIDVIKGNAGAPSLSGSFTDPNLPSGYAPFNIQELAGSLYVTYALRNISTNDEMPGPGQGLVDKFDLQGNLVERVATGGMLNAPWGLAFAPSSFGDLAGALLVGNFGDGRINAFDPSTSAFLGQLDMAAGIPLEIDGLWAITPGNDGNAGSSGRLYFTAGPGGEGHGLFGVVTTVPEPPASVLLITGLLGLLAWRRAD